MFGPEPQRREHFIYDLGPHGEHHHLARIEHFLVRLRDTHIGMARSKRCSGRGVTRRNDERRFRANRAQTVDDRRGDRPSPDEAQSHHPDVRRVALRRASAPPGIGSQGPSEQLASAVLAWLAERIKTAGSEAPKDLYEELLQCVEPPLLEDVIRRLQGNRWVAAQWLGLNRATVRKKLTQYGLADIHRDSADDEDAS